MPLEPLVEVAGSVLTEAAGAAFSTLPKPRSVRDSAVLYSPMATGFG